MDCEKCPIEEECKLYFKYWKECPLTKTMWFALINDVIKKAEREGKVFELKKLLDEIEKSTTKK